MDVSYQTKLIKSWHQARICRNFTENLDAFGTCSVIWISLAPEGNVFCFLFPNRKRRVSVLDDYYMQAQRLSCSGATL